jgi:iron complex outermembrane receptor protein
VLLATLLVPPTAEAQTTRVRGTVTDAQEQPLPDVNVVLTRSDDGSRVAGASTGADGTFSIGSVETGTYQLAATAVGYTKSTTTLTLEGGSRQVSLRLQKKRYGLDEVVVSAARSQQDLGNVASSVSVLSSQDLEAQSAVTGDLGDILAQQVPGLATSNGALSNFGQTMRGREPFIMIDGVPQTTPLRDGARSLRTTSSRTIERVEVIRGASALYGYGATGGAINYITREPTPGLEATTEVGVRASEADLEESFTGRLHQSVSGRTNGIGFVASGTYESWGQFYDGTGSLLPQDPRGQGGLAGADERSFFGKVTVPLASSQRLSGSVNYYSFRQDLEYGRQPGEHGETPTSPTTSIGTLPPKDPGSDNLVGQLRYEHGDVLGGQASAQAYVQDFETYFGYSDSIFPNGSQSLIESTKLGFRLDATTPIGLTDESQLLWGLDALRDQTAQPLVDGRTFAPEMTQTSAAPFAQLRVPVTDRLTVRGGARYELISLRVEDFRSWLNQEEGLPIYDTRNDVEGGTLTYSNVAFNAGAVYTVIESVDVFASFDQGFAVSEVGRLLRNTSAQSVEVLNPEAKTVNSYETGLRLGTQRLNASATGYYTTSELGSAYGPNFEIVRSPEHVYGVELTADVQVADPVGVGGTFSWVKGVRDADDDGSYETPLPGNRIPPEKITGYVEVSPLDGWTGRIQMLYSGRRDVFSDNTVYAQGSVSPYTVFDLSSRVNVGPGTLKMGIKNLFDNYYFPVRSQYPALNDSYTPAPGRQLSLGYSVTW